MSNFGATTGSRHTGVSWVLGVVVLLILSAPFVVCGILAWLGLWEMYSWVITVVLLEIGAMSVAVNFLYHRSRSFFYFGTEYSRSWFVNIRIGSRLFDSH